jgi:acylglycerol lipase
MEPDQTTISDSEELTLTGSGADIFVRIWRPTAKPRAVFAICHGFNAHSGHYGWVAGEMVKRGYAVYALDLRGRGQSSGERFYVDTFDDYVADLAAMIEMAKAREVDVPIFLLGHSAGGVTASLYAIDHQNDLAGLISESFAFELPAPEFALAVLKGLSHLVPHAHVLHLKNEDFSRDPEVVARLNADPLTAGETQPIQTVAALARADQVLRDGFPLIELPLLILHGTADKAAKSHGSELFHANAGSIDKTLKLYDGGFHDPLADIGREDVLRDIDDWIADHLRPAAP